jgi:hypothetical protein
MSLPVEEITAKEHKLMGLVPGMEISMIAMVELKRDEEHGYRVGYLPQGLWDGEGGHLWGEKIDPKQEIVVDQRVRVRAPSLCALVANLMNWLGQEQVISSGGGNCAGNMQE